MKSKSSTSNDLNRIKEGFTGQMTYILAKSRRAFCAKDAICRKLYITDIGFYPHALYHNRQRKLGCAQFILIYCVDGRGWFSIRRKIFEVKKNEYFILPKGIAHEYGSDTTAPWSIYWLHFTGEIAEHYANTLQPDFNSGPSIAAPAALRNILFEEILRHIELLNNTNSIIYANSILYAFLASFQKIHKHDQEDGPIEKAIAFMKLNLDRKLTVEQLAKQVNVSSSHLSALFKERTKHTPINLFTSLKIQKASQLLLDRQYNIKTIAASLGYDDQYHFSRVFKAVMGVSPRGFATSQPA